MPNGNRSNGYGGSLGLLKVLIGVAVLYFAREVLIPLALSLLLAFLLAPLVNRLRHWGLGRIPSTVIAVLCSFIVIGTISMVLVSQLSDLGQRLPEYQENVHKKLVSVRESGGGLLQRVSRAVHNLGAELTPPPAQLRAPGEQAPVPVEVRRSPFAPTEVIQTILGSVVSVVVTAAIVIVFVIFMLIQQEDLRDRLIRLGGAQRVNVTTKLLADAAGRVSRYLIAQLAVNVAFGALAGIGLFFIGVPSPLLWGMLAALLRYIPYLGIWIAGAMPAAVAFAVDPEWVKVPLVIGLYFGIDLLMYNFAEPLLYGSSTGVSPLAILVVAVFWTWLWGPVGLLLATPLTVCVVVLGRHVPNLGFLSVMLSDEEALTPQTRFYQRMLAMDLEGATEVAEEFLKGKSLEELYDAVIIPALTLAEEDRHRGKLDATREQFLLQNTRVLVEDLAERAEELVAGSGSGRVRHVHKGNGEHKQPASSTDILCIPARDEADEIAALMLAHLLQKRGLGARALPVSELASQCLEEVRHSKARIACVSAVPPFGYTHARYLCRRMRAQFPDVKLVAGILTERDPDELRQRQPAIPADELASSLKQELAQVVALAPVVQVEAEESSVAE